MLDKLLVFFFFQAEDGIRDKLVTGVQTCALPIYLRARARLERGGIPRSASPVRCRNLLRGDLPRARSRICERWSASDGEHDERRLVRSHGWSVAAPRHVPVPGRRAPDGARTSGEDRRLRFHRTPRADPAALVALPPRRHGRAPPAPRGRDAVLAVRRMVGVPRARRHRGDAGGERTQAEALMLGELKRDVADLATRVNELRGHL